MLSVKYSERGKALGEVARKEAGLQQRLTDCLTRYRGLNTIHRDDQIAVPRRHLTWVIPLNIASHPVPKIDCFPERIVP